MAWMEGRENPVVAAICAPVWRAAKSRFTSDRWASVMRARLRAHLSHTGPDEGFHIGKAELSGEGGESLLALGSDFQFKLSPLGLGR